MANSVEKTMIILRELSNCKNKPICLAELFQITGINKSTASHILKTLSESGYVFRVSRKDGYLPGAELFMLTRYGRYKEDIALICHPILKWLSNKTGATTIFTVMEGTKKYIVDHCENSYLYSDTGAQIIDDTLYTTITGRIIISHLQELEALKLYEKLNLAEKSGWDEVYDRTSFLNELKRLRQMDIITNITYENGNILNGFASPVFKNRKCIGALGVVLSRTSDTEPISANEINRISKLTLKCRKEFERRLNFKL